MSVRCLTCGKEYSSTRYLKQHYGYPANEKCRLARDNELIPIALPTKRPCIDMDLHGKERDDLAKLNEMIKQRGDYWKLGSAVPDPKVAQESGTNTGVMEGETVSSDDNGNVFLGNDDDSSSNSED